MIDKFIISRIVICVVTVKQMDHRCCACHLNSHVCYASIYV